jgi:hypothetical protein
MRNQRRSRLCGAPGQQRPAVIALCWPKASARELHQRNAGSIVSLPGGLRSDHPTETRKPSTLPIGSIEGSSRFLRSQLRRIGLGHPSRARLRAGPQQCSMGLQWPRSEPELSTLLGTGTFYFALTPDKNRLTLRPYCDIQTDGCVVPPPREAVALWDPWRRGAAKHPWNFSIDGEMTVNGETVFNKPTVKLPS